MPRERTRRQSWEVGHTTSEFKPEDKERKSPKDIEKEAYTYIGSWENLKQGRAEEYEPR